MEKLLTFMNYWLGKLYIPCGIPADKQMHFLSGVILATATSINKMAITAPATSSTLAVADGKTHTVNNSIALSGTDSTTMTFPATSATIARTDAAQTFTGAQTFSSTIGGATTIGVGAATPSASGAGITFPATQSASTNANTLDDYKEGTWTPNQGAGLTVVGAFSSTGTYTKIGRQVTIQVVLLGATSIACTGVSGVMCTNLPFAVSGLAIGGLTNSSNVATNTTFLLASTMYCNGVNVLASSNIIITATYFTS